MSAAAAPYRLFLMQARELAACARVALTEGRPVPTATTPAAAARIVHRLLEAAPQPTSTHQEATP